jgi:BirA family biotin operon repressor/biotin-[acetyl-CoA-carboxylase] ligase
MPGKYPSFFAVESGTMIDTNWNQAILESGLAGLPLGWVRYFSSTTSTNDVAARLAGEGAPDLSLIVAGEQTSGKGRMGRKWFSPPDASIAFSLALKAQLDTKGSADVNNLLLRYTALGALAVCDALETRYKLATKIKWPNDVLLENRKVCGILAESHWLGNKLESIILGVGINIHSKALPQINEFLFPATCIQDHVGENISRLELLQQVLSKLVFWRSQIESPAFIRAWEKRLAFQQEWVNIAAEPGGSINQTITGKITGLDSDGRLILQDQHGESLTIDYGELRLRPV